MKISLTLTPAQSEEIQLLLREMRSRVEAMRVKLRRVRFSSDIAYPPGDGRGAYTTRGFVHFQKKQDNINGSATPVKYKEEPTFQVRKLLLSLLSRPKVPI